MTAVEEPRLTAEDMDISQLDEEVELHEQLSVDKPDMNSRGTTEKQAQQAILTQGEAAAGNLRGAAQEADTWRAAEKNSSLLAVEVDPKIEEKPTKAGQTKQTTEPRRRSENKMVGDRPRDKEVPKDRGKASERSRGREDKGKESERSRGKDIERSKEHGDKGKESERSRGKERKRSRESGRKTEREREKEFERDTERSRTMDKDTANAIEGDKKRPKKDGELSGKAEERQVNRSSNKTKKEDTKEKATDVRKEQDRKKSCSQKPLSVRKSSPRKKTSRDPSDKEKPASIGRRSVLPRSSRQRSLPPIGPPPRRHSPPPRRHTPPPARRHLPLPRHSPPRQQLPPPAFRLRPSRAALEDRHGPPRRRPRSPAWERSPPRRPFPQPWETSPSHGPRRTSPPARHHEPGWHPTMHRDYPPDPYNHDSPRLYDRRPSSSARLVLAEEEMLEHKRPRLEEADRRVQSEWQRLKDYENELMRKEMALRMRERDAMIATPAVLDSWDPDSSRPVSGGNQAPWAHAGASMSTVQPGLRESEWLISGGLPLPPLPVPELHPGLPSSLPLPRPSSGIPSYAYSQEITGAMAHSGSRGQEPNKRVDRDGSGQADIRARDRGRDRASAKQDRPLHHREQARTKGRPTASDSKPSSHGHWEDVAYKPGSAAQGGKAEGKVRSSEASLKSSHSSRQKVAAASAPSGSRSRREAAPAPAPRGTQSTSHTGHREGPREDLPLPHRMARSEMDHRSGVARGPPQAPRLPPESHLVQEWYYRDPQGNIQGPASLQQLKLWLTQLANSADKTRHHVFCQTLVWKHGTTAQSGLPVLQLLDQFR